MTTQSGDLKLLLAQNRIVAVNVRMFFSSFQFVNEQYGYPRKGGGGCYILKGKSLNMCLPKCGSQTRRNPYTWCVI